MSSFSEKVSCLNAVYLVAVEQEMFTLFYCDLQGNDLQGVKAYFNTDIEGMYTLGTVVVDYRGYRITAQSIIPGMIIKHAFY